MQRPPLWGNFVDHADEDLLAFGILMNADLVAQAYYHGVQAVEKYLKALSLSLMDPDGVTDTPTTQPWIKTHDLARLADRCGRSIPYYSQGTVLNTLNRLAEFDQVARYPWVDQGLGNGFSSEDVTVIGDLCCRLRNDLPIKIDNYKLGMEVRGYFHGDSTRSDRAWGNYSHDGVAALRKLFPTIKTFVRGWDIEQR